MSRKPTLRAYNVIKTKDGKGFWREVGSVWTHKDKAGYNVVLHSVPVDGRIVIRKIGEKPEAQESDIPDYVDSE